MDPRVEKLDVLNNILKPPKELGGLFLPFAAEKQFDFVFIAEMPSMNMPKDWDGKSNYNFDVNATDKFFQSILTKHGVAGSYVTDIVKERAEVGRPTKIGIEKWLPLLLQEIEIIQPKYIVVIGEVNYEKNFKKFIEPSISENIKVAWVYHYRQQGSKTKDEVDQKFGEVINKMRHET